MSRPIWKGSIVFGLVSVPVQLETAVRERTVHFHMMSKDGSCRLHRKLYCPATGDEFEYDQTARGIEVSKDHYVLVDEKELDKLKPEKGRAIEIQQFCKLEQIDPIYFDHIYFVTPGEGGAKAYKLIREVLKNNSCVGVARFVMRDREYVAALRVMGEGLVLHTLHYADEILSLEDALPKSLERAAATSKEQQMAEQLIEAMTQPLDMEKFRDEYRERVEKLIEHKKHGKKTVAAGSDEEEPPPPTINLMEALKKSLGAGKPQRHERHAHRKSA